MVKRILILSDTHGAFERTKAIIDKFGPFGMILHCGDYLYHGPRNPIPADYDPISLSTLFKDIGDRLVGVKGNCDSEIDLTLIGKDRLPDSRVLHINGLDIYLCHGHRNESPPFERGLVINGHTHLRRLVREGSLLLLNPGSPSLPKDVSPGSFATIDFEKREISVFNLTGARSTGETF
jgi:putative phosphoesterase